MSERARKRRMCLDKKRYASYEAAAFFAGTDGMRAYKCPYGSHYHLTSDVRRKGRRR